MNRDTHLFYITFTIVGNRSLVEDVRNKLLKLEINIGFRKTKSIYEIYIRGNRQIIKLLNWLYEDNLINMKRKEEKYQDMIEWDLKKGKNKLLTIKN